MIPPNIFNNLSVAFANGAKPRLSEALLPERRLFRCAVSRCGTCSLHSPPFRLWLQSG